MPRCFLSLGGNLGAVDETFDQALERLADVPAIEIISRSTTHRTVAVGDDAGGEFLNVAVEIATELSPLELLSKLQAVENDLGRTREQHWGARTLDLDLLLYGSTIVEHPRLRVPHPACWYRRFVLDPLVEIATEVVHPERGLTIGELQARLCERPLRLGLAGGSENLRVALIDTLAASHAKIEIEHWKADADEPVLVAWLGPGDTSESDITLDALPRATRLDLADCSEPATDLRLIVASMLGE